MNVEIKVDSNCEETKIIIVTNKIDDEINALFKKLSEEQPQNISGLKDDKLVVLDKANIIRVYALDKKVFAQTNDGEYLLRLRLYEVEERLDKSNFIRISVSEIINIKKVKYFDLSFSGTICVSLTNGTVTYASRRYVAKIKHILGLWGK